MAVVTSPAYERNIGPILEVLQRVLGNDSEGEVVEVASGPGQHLADFARTFPELLWQPTEVDEELFGSICHHIEGLSNARPPLRLDTMEPHWPIDTQPNRLKGMVCVNLTHISPLKATKGLVAGAGRNLQPGGHLLIYGPFKIGGKFTTESNEKFDLSLRARNPEWGYRNAEDITMMCNANGLDLAEPFIDMPANNHFLHYVKR
eukprot:TRINITY_DN15508_c6_g1_i1.p1 TRINITY_DN15508_c6_g1~~TRINITY_DN15508_c6_g1_i1.p1  ORF type:complete len:230 (+),score=20.50 TRINITY_DN15508_c6_g1_i1:80-691(+)